MVATVAGAADRPNQPVRRSPLSDPRSRLARLGRALAGRASPPDPDAERGTVPDDLPRSALFAEPVRIDDLRVLPPEHLDDDRVRVTFRARVKDAEAKRCPDLFVEAELAGPERTAVGDATTDLMGHVRFRMTGPPGRYRITVRDVAAGGLDWDRDASTTTCEIDVS